MTIIEIAPQENYLLRIKTDDGQCGLFDVKPYLNSETFQPLKNPDAFSRVHNGGYFIEWDCGADLSLDSIKAHWQLDI